MSYSFARKRGPRGVESDRVSNTFTLTTPIEDAVLIRGLIGKDDLSGFFWRGSVVFLCLLYSDDNLIDKAVSVLDILSNDQIDKMVWQLKKLGNRLQRVKANRLLASDEEGI
jgi:hypothetical protein